MNYNEEEQNTPIIRDEQSYNREIKPTPKPPINIGIEGDRIYQDIIDASEHSQLDISAIEQFGATSQRREDVYQVLDTMGEDTLIASALEIYASDVTETNDDGKIMWVTSDDSNVQKFVTFLLDSMNVDKHLYGWAYSLCKYGDLYLRLYKESEFDGDLFEDEDNKKDTLNESVIVKMYKSSDKYVHYLEQVANPGEMFELTRFGKSYAYIQAKPGYSLKNKDSMDYVDYFKFSFKKDDVILFSPTNFVHACLDDNSTRTPEEVSIYKEKNGLNAEDNPDSTLTFRVRRGQSLLYKLFKIWRMMTLLEDSLILNRVTRSSIYRILNVEVGDMPKENVALTLQRLKQKLEQKQALNKDVSMSEYTNPGPMENIIYVPTRAGQGNISAQTMGGDVDVKGLADIDYFKNKFYAALGIPKQYLGDTDDATGFNGGTSLSLISSNYAKKVKRIQNALVQAITDAINIMLIDKNLDSYINKFQIHMLAPTTQEEVDRRDNLANQISLISDLINILTDRVEDPASQLKIIKSLVSDIITEPEVLDILEEEISRLEEEGEEIPNDSGDEDDSDRPVINNNMDLGGFEPRGGGEPNMDSEIDTADVEETEGGGEELPSPEQIGPDIDFTDNTIEF